MVYNSGPVTCLVVHALDASIAGNMGLIPSGGIKIPHATQCGQKFKKKKKKIVVHFQYFVFDCPVFPTPFITLSFPHCTFSALLLKIS